MNDANLALGLAIATLGFGPLLAWAMEGRASLRAGLDGFVLVMTAGLALVFLLPDAYEGAGIVALPIAAVGLFLPGWAERSLRPATDRSTPRFDIALAVAGLLFHCAVDGAALATAGSAALGAASTTGIDVTLAVVAHRLPVGLFVWSAVSSVAGRRVAWLGLSGLMVATGAGFVLGPALTSIDGGWIPVAPLVEALLAGGLLHVVVGHDAVRRSTSGGEAWAGAGALLALALIALVPVASHSVLAQAWETGHRLFVEASPAILLGFLGAGLLSLVPQGTLDRYMRGKTALGSAVRGVVFGLPIPICSCGVVPLYRGLMQKGLPPAAAAAFLVATPELGIDAVAISLPLLGWEMTLVRVLAATLLALCVGLAVAAIVPASETPPSARAGDDEIEERGQGLEGALRYGFVDSLDELGPWILAGIALAALVEPVLDPSWLAAVPRYAEIPLFASLSAPIYVCASAATPIGATFAAKGVSAGAVIAFLLVGPATNVTTYGAVHAFHGRNRTLLLGAILLGASLFLGAGVNLLVGGQLPVPVMDPEHAVGPISSVSALLLVGLLVASVLRQGPRGFLARLGFEGRGHDHHHAGDAAGGQAAPGGTRPHSAAG